MKPGGSALNPNAKPFVPLSRREGYRGDSAKPAATHHVQPHQPYVAHGFGAQGRGSYPGSQMYMPQNMGYKQTRDEDMEMDLDIEFLLSTFSGLSQETISDVYLANNHDLDATIEMLNQLEIYSNEADGYLPETLDIGDGPEIIEPTTPKEKNASNEASASTSSGTTKAPVSSP